MAPISVRIPADEPTSRHASGRARGGGTLVSVGRSTRYLFQRLVDTVIEVLPMLPKPVVIQYAGLPPPVSPGVTAIGMLSHEDFLERMRASELLICHAGAGTILDALRVGVPTIVMARQAGLGEIADGHQTELADTLSRLGLVRAVADAASLRAAIDTLDRRPRPLKDPLNQSRLVDQVQADIASCLRDGARPSIALVATSGGHMTELRELARAYEGIAHFYVSSRAAPAGGPAERSYVFPSADRDWRIVRNIPAILRMLVRERPGIVLSTGSSSAVPVIMLAKLLGARVIFVESVTRVLRPSLTARVVYPASDAFIVRWPGAASAFGNARLVHAGSSTPPDAAAPADAAARPVPVAAQSRAPSARSRPLRLQGRA
jgi:beta-1,4-N-acetylglucosaminyltransferase